MKSPVTSLWLLAVVLVVGFSGALLLPKASPMKPSRLATELPAKFGAWEGTRMMVSERELQVLAADTRFERRLYERPFNRTLPSVEASLVFSGKDINNSIHRPEVCLVTQGWNFVRQRYVMVPGILPNGEDLPVRELVCRKNRRGADGELVRLPSGDLLEDWQILYYTFIGAESVTASHYGRVFHDIRDRVIGGYDQQWAYATFSSLVPGKYAEQGVDIGILEALDLDGAGEHLANFMRDLLPDLLGPGPSVAAREQIFPPLSKRHADQ
jgi:hypothetical protein